MFLEWSSNDLRGELGFISASSWYFWLGLWCVLCRIGRHEFWLLWYSEGWSALQPSWGSCDVLLFSYKMPLGGDRQSRWWQFMQNFLRRLIVGWKEGWMWQVMLIWRDVWLHHRLICEGMLIYNFRLEYLWFFTGELPANVLDFLFDLSRRFLDHKIFLATNGLLVLAEPVPKLVIFNTSLRLETAKIRHNCSEYLWIDCIRLPFVQ